ncbi:MAG: hypothetical protein KDK37_06830 [Leptospiraceae bacterium]|nr:hypothetical protein [Leptospiraceae bacterium]
MKSYSFTGVTAALALSFVSFASIQADTGLCCLHCGGNMPLNILGAGIPETHEFRFKIKAMHMSMRGVQSGYNEKPIAETLSLPASMSMGMDANTMAISNRIRGELTGRKYMAVPQRMYMNMYDLSMAYSFTDRFAAMVMTMYQEKFMKMKFNPMMQSMLGMSHYTMESRGMTDTMIMGKYRILEDDTLAPTNQLSIIAGLSLPTGSIDEKNSKHPLGNPTAPLDLTTFNNTVPDRKSEPMPYSMQMGSGTFDPIAGIAYQGSASPFWWGATFTYKGRAYKNKHGYALGDEYKLDAYAMYQISYNVVSHIQFNAEWINGIRGEHEDAYKGDAGRSIDGNLLSEYMSPAWDPRNYGGEVLSVSAGIQWQPIPLQILEVTATVPVSQRWNGLQMTREYSVQVAYYVEIPTSGSVRHEKKKKAKTDDIGF